MSVSLGFLIALILIVLPGIIFRRLYFYGEFSKQFNAGINLVKLIAISSIYGFIILIITYLFNHIILSSLLEISEPIDIGVIIDKVKEIEQQGFKYSNRQPFYLTDLANNSLPYLGWLYSISIVLGLISGRFIRISNLDTKFKLLRFKNYWFYYFNSLHTGFKKMKGLRETSNKKHLFTQADILIDTSEGTKLYSGIVMDYELSNDDCNKLSKIVLREVSRFNEKKELKNIPGNIFIIDCSNILNINLTYFFGKADKSILDTKLPERVVLILGVIYLLILPFFIFQMDGVNNNYYNALFGYSLYVRILIWFLLINVISMINPFVKVNNKYQWYWKYKSSLIIKITVFIVFCSILYKMFH